jgi:methylglutaconyl-CoA hydratase
MNLTTISLTQIGVVATVTLQRPQQRNAFNAQSILELRWAFDTLAQQDDVRVIVLAAAGGDGCAFCAGADLHWMSATATASDVENRNDALALAAMLSTIYNCPQPVVAKIHGDVYGGGVGLVAACDIAIAVDTVHFCLSEVKIGLIPATISPYVIQAMGQQAARRYFLTAERFTALEAHRIGLIHERVTADTLDQTVQNIVGAISSAGPLAVRKAKRLVTDISGKPIDAALSADTAERIAMIRHTEEAQEGMRAFLGKRKPAWLVGK